MSPAGLLLALAAGAGTLAVGTLLVALQRRGTRRGDGGAVVALPEATTEASVKGPSVLRPEAFSASTLDTMLANAALRPKLDDWLGRARPGWTTGTLVGFVLLAVSVGLLAALTLGPWIGASIAVVGGGSPVVVARRSQAARLEQLEQQLPSALDMLVNALRAGYSLLAAMRFVGEELPAPVGPEFARFFEEQQLGIDQRQALVNLQDRLDSLDARMFVLALLIQRETGGNLSEVLGKVSRVIRLRVEFRRQLSVLTAEAKMSALILAALPVFMFGVMWLINPEYIEPLATTLAGRVMLGYGAISLTIGFLLLRRIARIEV